MFLIRTNNHTLPGFPKNGNNTGAGYKFSIKMGQPGIMADQILLERNRLQEL